MHPAEDLTEFTCQIGMLLLPGFNGFAAQAFLDPFRAANYLRGSRVYDWHFLSLDGASVVASNGVEIGDTTSIVQPPPPTIF